MLVRKTNGENNPTAYGVVAASEQLFNYLFKTAAPIGISSYVWCSFYAPYKAAQGDAEGAVDSAMTAVGALSAGVLMSAGAGAAGVVAGVGAGMAIIAAPSMIINAFDTSKQQYLIQVYNFTKYPVFLDASMISPRSAIDPDGDYHYKEQTGSGPGVFDKEFFSSSGAGLYNRQGMVIPPTAYDPTTQHIGAFCLPLPVNDKSFCFSFRFFAREGNCRQLQDAGDYQKHEQWWRETTQPDKGVHYSWTVGCEAPGSRFNPTNWGANNRASIWPAAGNDAPDHSHAYHNMAHQSSDGRANGNIHQQENSACYWKDDWKTLVVELGMPDAK